LKALFLISESRNIQGAGFVLFALVLYIVGSYTPYALWLRLCSLMLFIVGYLTLTLDFRISRLLFLPLVALLLVVLPIGVEVFEVQNLLALFAMYLSVDAIIVVLLVYILKERAHLQETKGVKCPICRFEMFKDEVFCPHCGRQRLPLKPKPFKFGFTKFLVLFLIVLVLSFVYVPTFSLADREASMVSYTPNGIEKQTIIPPLEGWRFESFQRLVGYEREHLEDFVAIATYVWGEISESRSHIQLEIGHGSLYMSNAWQLLGWKRSRQDVVLTECGVSGQYVVLQKENKSITVLHWTMKLMFRVGSLFSTRNVGVSVFSNFTEPTSESRAAEVLAEFRRVSVSIVDWWNFVNRWALNLYTLNEIYVRFKDVFFTAASVVAVLMLAAWVKVKDEKNERQSENALVMMENEATLLITLSNKKRRRFLGSELFDAFHRFSTREVDLDRFYEKLRKLSMAGLVEKDYVLKGGELVSVWKRAFF